VAIDRMGFMVPVPVGAQLAFHCQVQDIGRSSITIKVEVWSDNYSYNESRKVSEATFVLVAIDDRSRTRVITSCMPRRHCDAAEVGIAEQLPAGKSLVLPLQSFG